MVSYTSTQNYYLYPEPMDMRKDISTLSAIVTSQMRLDPYTEGNVYMFLSRNLNTMKVLYRGKRRFELTKIRLDDEKFFRPVFDEERCCHKICWSDFVALTEGTQMTHMTIKSAL